MVLHISSYSVRQVIKKKQLSNHTFRIKIIFSPFLTTSHAFPKQEHMWYCCNQEDIHIIPCHVHDVAF